MKLRLASVRVPALVAVVMGALLLTGCISALDAPAYQDSGLGRMHAMQPLTSANGITQTLEEYGVFYSTDRNAVVEVDRSSSPTDGVNIFNPPIESGGVPLIRRQLSYAVASSEPGTFSIEIKGLAPGTRYYTRFYAIGHDNADNTRYTTLFPVGTHRTSNPTLKSLKASRGTVSPSFSRTKYTYTNTISRTTSSSRITVAPTVAGSVVQMRIGTSGSFSTTKAKTVSVSRGKSKVLYIRVTAPEGVTATYKVTVRRRS